jgi:hypothetical protein
VTAQEGSPGFGVGPEGITVSGTLTATGAFFLHTNNFGTSQLLVNAGGQLTASNTDFAWANTILAAGTSILTPGQLSNNSFDTTLSVPILDVPMLANNRHFQNIDIQGTSLTSGQTVSLNVIGTDMTTTPTYVFPVTFPNSSYTVQSGARLNIGQNATVQISTGVTLIDSGTIGIATGATVTAEEGSPGFGVGTEGITVSGTLTATGAFFQHANNFGTSQLVVNAGGQLTASDTDFAWANTTLAAGTGTLTPGQLSNNSFDTTLSVPILDVPMLANNRHFQNIDIQGTSLTSGQTVSLNVIGTDMTTSPTYVFPVSPPSSSSSYTIQSGATLDIGPNVNVQISTGVTVIDNGTISVASNATVTAQEGSPGFGVGTEGITVNGTLTATGAFFQHANNFGTSQLVVNAGGQLTASDTDFAWNSLTVSGTFVTQGTGSVQNLIVSGANDTTPVIMTGTLTVTGALLWTGGTITGSGSPVPTINIQNGATLSGGNDETLDTVQVSITGGITDSSTGKLVLVHGAQWNLTAGSFTNMSTIIGEGTFMGPFTNSGTLEPGDAPGRIKNIGPYMQTAAGTLTIQTAGTVPSTGYSQLDVNGSQVSLAGTLDLEQQNGFFPQVGDKFTVLQNEMNVQISGTFTQGSTLTEPWVTTNQDGSTNPHPVTFAISYQGGAGGHDVVLTDTTPTPTHIAVNQGTLAALVGTLATNSGTWSDVNPTATVTLSASEGTITKNASGTWSWSDTPTGGARSDTVTITESDGTSTLIVPFTLTVQDNTTTAVTASSTPSVFGQLVTFTAAVTPNHMGSALSPTGRVDFTEGTTDLTPGGVPVSAGIATFSTAALSVGSHTITAAYGGDTHFLKSSGSDSSSPQVVNRDDTLTADVTSSADPSVHGETVTFSVVVRAAAPGAGVPTGTVTFRDGTTTLGNGLLNVGGVATFTTSTLSLSAHTITASYGGDGNFKLSDDTASSTPLVQTVGKAPTTTSDVTSSLNSSVHGQTITFSVTVIAAPPGAGVPTGTVIFSDQNGTLGSGTLNGSGLATFATATLSTSAHTITASYNGDSNFKAGDDTASPTPLVQTVDKAPTTTSDVTSPVNSSVHGQTVTFSVTVSSPPPGAGAPTGTVTFRDQNGTLGSGTLNGTGLATFSTSTLSTSAHTVTATYGGDTNFNGSNDSALSTPLVQTVSQAKSSTGTVSSTANPSVHGQTITLSVMVSPITPGGGVPTGTVIFRDQNGALGSGTLNGSGRATFAIATLSTSAHTITASYSGDTNFILSDDTTLPLVQKVNKATTSTSNVTSSVNPSVHGQTVTFSVTVSAVTAGHGTPTGSVTLSDQGGTLGRGTLNGSGVATFSTATLSTSAHTVTASYVGDSNFKSSDDTASATPLVQSVGRANSRTSIVVSSVNPSVHGQPVIFAVAVGAAPGAGVPTGTVTFSDQNGTLGTGTLNASGLATLATSTLSTSMHTVTASYLSDSNFKPSDDTAGTRLVQTVNQAKTSTSAVTSSANPSGFGQAVTFSVTVRAVGPGAGMPTGSVTFSDQSGTLGSGTPNASGLASFTTSTLSRSAHTITARYSGDTNFSASDDSASPLVQTVKARTSTGDVTSSVNPSFHGQSITFSVTVSIVGLGTGTPAGTVGFSDQNGTLGTGTLNSSGVATFTTSTLSTSAHTITASYGGDANFLRSNDSASSTPLVQAVNQAAGHVAIGASVEPSVIGQTITLLASVTALAPGAGVPTGTITFDDLFNGTSSSLGTVSLNTFGVARFGVSSLALGNHTIMAVYGGDANFKTQTSASYTEIVQQSGLIATLQSSLGASTFGQVITFVASEKLSSGAAASGSITFQDGGTTLGLVTLDSSGRASFSTASLSVGNHTIFAFYRPPGATVPSNRLSCIQSVAKAGTATALTVSPNPAGSNTTITFSATVATRTSGGGTPTGSVIFSDGKTILGRSTISAGGVATFTSSTLTPGIHTITAAYAGDANDNGSVSSAIQETVNPTVASAVAPLTRLNDSSALQTTEFDALSQWALDEVFSVTGPVSRPHRERDA